MSDLLTLSGAARLLKVSEGTVLRLANSGQLPHEYDSAGRRIFHADVVRRIANERANEERKRQRLRNNKKRVPALDDAQ